MLKYKALRLPILASALAIMSGSALAEQFQYSNSHFFTVPDAIKDRPFTDITIPGSHNSWNTQGIGGSCTNYNPAATDNNNTDARIWEQADRAGLSFFEIDIYRQGNNLCAFHGGGGNSLADGNNKYFGEVLDDIRYAQEKANGIVFIKIDGGSSTFRDDFIESYFQRHGLLDSIYINNGQDETPPTYRQLEQRGIKYVIVFGSQRFSYAWSTVGTDTGHHDRTGPTDEVLQRTQNQHTVRFNAFALNGLGYGDKDDQRYITGRLISSSIEKWIQAGHRISHLVTDYADMHDTGMSPARAANILNQVPSAYGTITDENGDVMTDVRYSVFLQNINLRGYGHWFHTDGYNNRTIISHSSGDFDFPRPHGQNISIRPQKDGYRFEPEVVYLSAEDTAESVEVKFKAIKEDSLSLQSFAESHSFIYKSGRVDLAAGVGLDSSGEPVVRDTTRQKGFAITNRGSKLCIGLPKGNLQAGTGVFTQICDASIEQRWNYEPETGYIRSMKNNGNFCLDTAYTGSSGSHIRMFDCSGSYRSSKTWNFDGKEIFPTVADANAIDSNGVGVGAALISWNRSSPSDNRRWVFQKHYAVSAEGDNHVTDASSDNKRQHFLLASHRFGCLTARGSDNGDRVHAYSCVIPQSTNNPDRGNPNDLLWYGEGNLIYSANGKCLDNEGEYYLDGTPAMHGCNASSASQWWLLDQPTRGKNESRVHGLRISTLLFNYVLEYPRDNYVRLGNYDANFDNEFWTVIPVDR